MDYIYDLLFESKTSYEICMYCGNCMWVSFRKLYLVVQIQISLSYPAIHLGLILVGFCFVDGVPCTWMDSFFDLGDGEVNWVLKV